MEVRLRGRVVACGFRTTRVLKRDGVKDTAEAARTYLHTIIGDVVAPEKIDTYLERGPGDAVVRAEELAAEAVLGARLLRLLPGGRRRQADRTVRRAEAVRRQEARRRREGPRAAVRQGADEHGRDAAGLRPAQPAQAPSARRAAQPQGRHPRDVGQGHRQEPGRHGPRPDRADADRPAEGRRPGRAQHRADRPVRRGRRRARRVRSRHHRTGVRRAPADSRPPRRHPRQRRLRAQRADAR